MIDDRHDGLHPVATVIEPMQVVPLDSYERIADLAKQGMIDPGLLSDKEIRLICRTLVIQYAQLGIG